MTRCQVPIDSDVQPQFTFTRDESGMSPRSVGSLSPSPCLWRQALESSNLLRVIILLYFSPLWKWFWAKMYGLLVNKYLLDNFLTTKSRAASVKLTARLTWKTEIQARYKLISISMRCPSALAMPSNDVYSSSVLYSVPEVSKLAWAIRARPCQLSRALTGWSYIESR